MKNTLFNELLVTFLAAPDGADKLSSHIHHCLDGTIWCHQDYAHIGTFVNQNVLCLRRFLAL